ncbi:serine/threonine-protein kinase Nek8-like isoform X2 [Zootermopsis nevadensis]|uniref:serine/threonine-protein kinase Nek8-like isoform X2 n=1 Tax=Zootermopsis nevadensis TaxID=136037 RepID=UPI000B8EC218|nr:serine/threonine-protein kinase Nek8-like isoform X2 [Zootermopsis nevadensis]
MANRPDPSRLIVASSRAPHLSVVLETVHNNVKVVQYKYETCTLDDILVEISKTLGRSRVETVALLMHCSETEIFICFTGGKVLSLESVKADVSIREFLNHLVGGNMNLSSPNCRLDFLNASPSVNVNGGLMTHQLEMLLNLPVGMSKDLFGVNVELTRMRSDPESDVTVGELYFNVKKLREKLQVENSDAGERRLEGYEKIRTVGKGAFGTAVLYHKVADGTLIVIKEVNMIDLTASERQMALNEVQVLSSLDHPNIISYFGSFERDGVLMIKMEYADGGTLAQMLSRRARRLDEREIIMLFRQIVAAIRYMHDHNILHRDLKTANVFLNKDNTIKVGDFGISKIMTTRAQAQTVLGTPYYISPEMCEGKQYDQKSDIWALGCILYEMACLQKTFEGSNLPALVNKIMKGHFQPVPGGYSPGFRQLIHDLLQRDPAFRPTAAEILDSRLLLLLDSLKEGGGRDWFLDHDGSVPNLKASCNRSVLYDLKSYESAIALTPIQLPPRSKVTEVAVSSTHIIVLTSEMLVYSWGEGKRGQLGHGDTEPWRQHPGSVEALKGKSINRIGAGDGYSVFVSDSGMVMTCGDGTFGCLGHGDWNNSTRPRLIEKLLSVDVVVVGCGPHHVAVLSRDGEMYAWGRGDGGRLGLGHEEDCCSPVKVTLPNDCVLRTLRCGGDGTAVLTTDGVMMTCGRNSFNKLGLSDSNPGFFSFNFKGEVEKALTLNRVKGISYKVADISLGSTHTAVLTESGHVITFGRNAEGQLGRGHRRSASSGPMMVKSMADKCVTMVQCGPTYTVVGSIENTVYFWGTRYSSFNYQDLMGNPKMNLEMSGGWSHSKSTNKFHDHLLYGSQTGSQYTSILIESALHSNHLTEILLEPQEILALYASATQIEKGETVCLAGLYPMRYSLLVLVDTTVPLAHLQPQPTSVHHSNRTRDGNRGSSGSEEDSAEEESAQGTDFDSLGPVPEWIKAELAQSEAMWTGFSEAHSSAR